MRLFLTMLALVATSVIASPSVFASQSDPVVLPVEIMGPAGTTETVTVHVDDASNIAGLWMQVHNLSYDNKASIKINNGAWIDLSNESVDVAAPEVHIGGIGGGYSTIRLTLPLSSSAVSNGINTLQFRFNGTNGLSSGWRVLQFNFVRADGSFILPESTFREDDPATWTPIYTSQADIEKGADLWYNEPLLEADGTPIKARCADCHATDGRDLKYFSYSDKSIVERSKFHGLTQKEGEQIASFIRSIDVPAPGRPWNPPYQPGPGLDSKPVEEWAAGAGLEWVLDDDSETLPYLFPNGITDASASTKSTLNMRELPLALQFPDWNRWLPPVHPVDFWGDAFLNSEVWEDYSIDIPNALASGVEQAIQSKAIINAIQGLDSDVSDFRENQPLPAGKTVQDQTQGNLGLQLWQLVKVWEVMQANQLEDRASDLYADGEVRSWFSQARNVFNVAPHISGAGGSTVHTHGSEQMDKFFSHAWYMYQVVINPGNRDPKVHKPVDWKYQFGHLGDYTKHTILPSGARLIATYIKMIQMLDNEDGIGTDGWYLRHAHPYWFVRSLAPEPDAYAEIWGSVPEADHARIAEVMLRSFMVKTLEFDIEEWPRGENHEDLEPASYKPVAYDGKGSIFEDRFNYADNFYRIIPEFLDRGVAPSLLDTLATWGEAAWPLGDWENLVDYVPPPDPGPLPTVAVSLDAGSPTALEPGGSGNKGKFIITRSGDTNKSLQVTFTLTGTAQNGVDYATLESHTTFAAGETEVKLKVDPIDDTGIEGPETVLLTLSSNAAYTIDAAANKTTMLIEDNDNSPVVLYGDTSGDGTISALDAALVLQHAAGSSLLTDTKATAGDVSGDGSLSGYDASLILQFVLAQIPCFPSDSSCAGKQ